MTQPDELPPRRRPWAWDNGAFKAWKNDTAFDRDKYLRAADIAAELSPEWMIVPDIVAGGLASLDFSLGWLREIEGVAPCYLAVQDGMSEADVEAVIGRFAGLFVGGTLPWKIATGPQWVDLAHRHGKPCHVGRVGTARRVRWAMRIGVDSIDSCLPLWSAGNLRVFADAIDGLQQDLFALDPQPTHTVD